VHSTSVLHFEQRYLFPNELATYKPPRNLYLLFFDFHGLSAACQISIVAFGDNKLAAALGAAIPFTNYICHIYALLKYILLV